MFRDIQQGSEEWFGYRRGQPTASNFGIIMANYGKAFGEPARRYAMRLALESKLGKSIETYKNEFMDRGTELEPFARELYEQENFVEVKNGGFMENKEFGVGGSCDGIVDESKIIEIKSVIYTTHFERLLTGGYDTSYQWQIQGNIWLYDAKYCDFISYCPEFPAKKRLYVFTVERNEEAIEKLKLRLTEFKKLVEEYKRVI